MSTPFGIDFGNATSVIGVAKNRGIDVIVNEVSNRATPSLVGFGQKNRYIGESAKSNEISNLKNTVGSLKRILGRKHGDPALEEEKAFISSELVDVNGDAGVKVSFQGEKKTFNSVQLAAMYFNKLKDTTEHELKAKVSDVVIAVPLWYTDVQRRAVADAAVIAGLNPVRIINDVSAAAVGYGVFKTDLPEDKPRNVAILDFGHSSYSIAIVAFKKGEGKVLGLAYDKDFGGRIIDLAIAKHLAEEFKEKYKIDVLSHPKAFSRVLAQAEKVKKVLSANSSAPFNVESIMNDVDVSAMVTREQLEGFIQPYLEKLHVPIEKALEMAGLKASDLDAVELIGGNSRVPAIKEQVSKILGLPLSFTLNQDEAVARGAAFVCAVHSPTVRVRPFKFEDLNLHGVTFYWEPVEEEETSEMEVFPAKGAYPSSKALTLFRKADFDMEAKYTHPETLEPGTDAWIGKWSIKGVTPDENGEPVAVKIRLRHDPSGFYTVESAYSAVEKEVEEPIEGTTEAQAGDAKAGEAKEGEEEQPKTHVVKKWFKKDNLTIVHSHKGLDEATKASLFEHENSMVADDKLVKDTEDRKNALEEYIYDIRGKIDDIYADFSSDEEKVKVRKLADDAEEWLYGDGEDATKAQYIAKYEELAAVGNVIRGRYLSHIEEEKQKKNAAKEAEKQRLMAEKIQADHAAKKAAEEAAAAKEESKGEEESKDDSVMDDVE